ncbi:MAG: gliding motility-associated C-terminal domain-containing protein, partial [Bacteroidota bacterium]|nr:gliding motility-associated C-terminal domain-containing protein [Bacteroidota bacterium]
TQPDELILTDIITDILCYGDSIGSIQISISGGVVPYNILWNTPLADTSFIDSLIAGEYTVIVTDSNLCQLLDTFTVSQPDSIELYFAVSNVVCPGDTTGSIDLTIVGGISPYTYYWSTGDTTQDIYNQPDGMYIVSVIDSLGCQRIDTAYISAPVFYGTFVVTNIACNGYGNGAIDLTVVGGTSPYTYLWSDTGASISQDLSNLSGGTYYVTITDATGCIIVEQATVYEPNVLNLSIISTDVSCYGYSDGMVDLTVLGGTTPYTYFWSGPGGPYFTEDINNISAGTYSCFVNDVNNCNSFISVVVGSPPEIIATPVIDSISCFGLTDGSINLTVTGGVAPYEYLWITGDTLPYIVSLPVGNYTITITDTTGCEVNLAYILAEPDSLMASIVGTNVACYGESNGWADLTVTGGTSPYTFNWLTGQNTEDIFNLPAGNYNVTITDSNGCFVTDSVFINQPEFPLNATYVVTNVSCNGGNDGSIDLTPSGGTSPYYFNWPSIPATTEDVFNLSSDFYIVFIIDSMGCEFELEIYVSEPPQGVSIGVTFGNVTCYNDSNGYIVLDPSGGTSPYTYQWQLPISTADSIYGLGAGNYFVTVTDSLGCEASEVIGIIQPDPIFLQFSNTNISCNGGSDGAINLTVTGGVAPFSFAWSSGPTTEDLSNIQAGSYAVTVTDANGCSTQAPDSVSEPPQPINAALSATDVSCYGGNNGTITTIVTGGTQPYSFIWSNGSGTNQNLTGLEAGVYILTITDDNLCEFTISITISQPSSALQTSILGSNITCYGYDDGNIFVSASGGTYPYSYLWTTSILDTTNYMDNLEPGFYEITVTDDNDCESIVSTEIIEPPQIQMSFIIEDVLCHGDSTGLIDLNVSGGSSPYTFNWSNFISIEDLDSIPEGLYFVTVTDNNSCFEVDSIEISGPANPLGLELSGVDVNCNSTTSGSVSCLVSGGTYPFTYVWSTGANTQNLDSLTNGMYMLTVSDYNGCTSSGTVEIFLPVYVNADLNVLSNYNGFNVSCYGADDGMVNVNVLQGTPPYTYQWSNGASGQSLDNLFAGVYAVIITDAVGCSFIDTLQLFQPPELHVSPLVVAPNCPTVDDGSIQLNVNGGIPPYSFAWSNQEFTEDIFNLPAGTYTITVSDVNGCNLIYQEFIDYEYQECLFIPSAITPNGDGYNDVWQIRGIELFPDTYIEIYDRWGQVMFKSNRGYTQKWDGTFDGKKLPIDTYFYVIELNDGSEPIIGPLTIVR